MLFPPEAPDPFTTTAPVRSSNICFSLIWLKEGRHNQPDPGSRRRLGRCEGGAKQSGDSGLALWVLQRELMLPLWQGASPR